MLKFAKFIGANTDFSTAQAYLFPRVLSEGAGVPVFGLLISGEGDDVFIGVRQKILNLEEVFDAPFERATEKLHEIGELIKSELDQIENLKFTLFCTKDNVFYAYQFGNNFVELLRAGEFNPIFQDPGTQEKVISGFLQPGDRVLILSAKPTEKNWEREVLEQVFRLPIDDSDDAEVIFASNELKSESQEDLAGVKNIEPVAFILVNNPLPEGQEREEPINFKANLPKINVKFKMPNFNLWLTLHRLSRRLFALIRRTNKKLLIGILVLLLISIISLSVYLFNQSRNFQKNQRVSNLVSSIDKDLNEATGLKDSDFKQAGEKIAQAKLKLEEVKGLEKDASKIKELSEKVDEKEAEVLKIYKNFNLDLFISLDLIKQKFNTERMSFSVDTILLLDSNEKSLISVDTKLKTTSIIAGRQQLGQASIASLNGSNAFVYSPDKGIISVDADTRKASVITGPDPEWGNISDIFGFSGNLYALDTGKNQIWKYAPTESGFTGKLEYLQSPNSELRLGKKLMIDYSVWVLTSEPGILKFTAGNEDYFALSGLSSPLTQIDSIFVPEELDAVFILDKSTNRILVTKKNGEYLAQYINPEFSKVSDLFLDEKQKLIYLLIENKIYTTPLR